MSIHEGALASRLYLPDSDTSLKATWYPRLAKSAKFSKTGTSCKFVGAFRENISDYNMSVFACVLEDVRNVSICILQGGCIS